jgi:epoxide hydrolase-like predicted phosphatase
MTIRAVVLDIGGVLEITPQTGWMEKWEKLLHLKSGELEGQLERAWGDGALKERPEAELQKSLREITGMDQAQVDAFVHDFWKWYLGELNVELATYFSRLRPRYQTALLSNSFSGARKREQELYHFDEMTDLIIYSHEVGVAKPDRRIFELTWQRLGVQPEEMLFLDNAQGHVKAAQACGIQAILYENNDQAIETINQLLAKG